MICLRTSARLPRSSRSPTNSALPQYKSSTAFSITPVPPTASVCPLNCGLTHRLDRNSLSPMPPAYFATDVPELFGHPYRQAPPPPRPTPSVRVGIPNDPPPPTPPQRYPPPSHPKTGINTQAVEIEDFQSSRNASDFWTPASDPPQSQ